MRARILCLDEDLGMLEAYREHWRHHFDVDVARHADEALALIAPGRPYSVVIINLTMAGLRGAEFLRKLEERTPESIRIVLADRADFGLALDAINEAHAYRFFVKPCSLETLARTVESAVQKFYAGQNERELAAKTLNSTVHVLQEILALTDPISSRRGARLREYVRSLAEALEINQTWDLETAALLSGIGHLTVPLAVLEKFRSGALLTFMERDLVTRIPEFGANLLLPIPGLESVSRIVLYQNKSFDGTGFPFDYMAGLEIPLGARMLRLLTDLIQLESAGPHKAKRGEVLRNRSGCYDPNLLKETMAVLIEAPPKGALAVTLQALRAGHVLLTDIETDDGILLVPSGTEISPILLNRLDHYLELKKIKEPIYIRS